MTAAALKDELTRLRFLETAVGRLRFYLTPGLAPHAAALAGHLAALQRSPAAGLGNRRSALPLTAAGLPPMFARRSRRGGMMRFVSAEIYAGLAPRPLHELAITAIARRRGLPVVDPLGAAVEWLAPGLYRGWFLSRALEGATLWQFLLDNTDSRSRRAALEQARGAIDRLHEGGLYHADLNFHNLFVSAAPPAVTALDLDKARLYPHPLPPALRRANFARLTRSARKLTTAGAALTPAERTILGIGAT
jgi:3-deoxy-D-manno-octulosonic acid kinase